ncbi:MAG TPA: EAL domain-containing protein [Egibacteraceae bacterium]|nr:EAL domain-containing protein [Egibacteraceae bacterium]
MVGERSRPPLHVVGESEPVEHGRALLDAGVDMAYQPIVHLGSGSVIAYEALARPRHPDARNPMVFFSTMAAAGLRLAAERAAFSSALHNTRAGYPRAKLFINASPVTLVDPEFDVAELARLAQDVGMPVSNIVVEVTESEAVHDLDELAERTRLLRRLGIGIAVDDAGAGHASFRVITRLRPSFIKLDRDLVSDIDSDGARHAFIESMVRFSRQIGSRLIAEGIETPGELACVAGLAVEAGQGYFLARPAVADFAEPTPESRRTIESAAQRLRLGNARVAAADLARPAIRLDPSITIREAYERFAEDASVGVMAIYRPYREGLAGQITRRALERAMSAPDAWASIGDRPVSELADYDPLTVAGGLWTSSRSAASSLLGRLRSTWTMSWSPTLTAD